MDDNDFGPSQTKLDRRRGGIPIVGVGAGAGDLDSVQRLFARLAPDCGMAFVVVQHGCPGHQGIEADALTRSSRVAVRPVESGMTLVANAIHLAPPNAALTIKKLRLYLDPTNHASAAEQPVDRFFLSLAREGRESAAAVILPGAGSDGIRGLRAIQQQGGVTLAQANAEYDGMMHRAIMAGAADFVVPIDTIAARLADHFRGIDPAGSMLRRHDSGAQASPSLDEVYALLRARTGHDFKDYKDRTIIRRLQRRMQLRRIDNISAYVSYLHREPAELDLLFQDLLIGVTDFFRDSAAFDALREKVVPRLFEGKNRDDGVVRIWVPGCATGEEAYAIAMLLHEAAGTLPRAPKLQIFATDIDEQALAQARGGRYPAGIAADVPDRLLGRYFRRENGIWRVTNEIREICLFSRHNLLHDAPFSRIDLISCRNLLIYFNTELQDRVIHLFHFALRERGFLFLGTAESAARQARLFEVVDKVNRIYRSRSLTKQRLPQFPLSAAGKPRRLPPAPIHRPQSGDALQALLERWMMERYVPAHVVVNANGDLLHASTRTGHFLELPVGAPDHNVFNFARSGLGAGLRAALYRAVSTGQISIQSNVFVLIDGSEQAIDLVVEPLPLNPSGEPLYLVVFKEIGGIHPPATPASATDDATDTTNVRVRGLESELRAMQERLRAATEALEASNEELKSVNEELSSMNEELQSANEELETSGEELKSINEELQGVNAELNARVEELSRTNSDVLNLLESTQIATVFLDLDLCVKRFTPAAREMFHLIDSDMNRPITDVRARFVPESVRADVQHVLRTRAPIERQVFGTEENATSRYIMRVVPYRTIENGVGGVVMTFTDITRVSAAEARVAELTRDLRNRVESLERMFDLVPVGVFVLEDRARDEMRINRRGAALIGRLEKLHHIIPVGEGLRLRVGGAVLPDEQHPLWRAARTGEPCSAMDAELMRGDGSTVDVVVSSTPLFDDAGIARGAIAAVVDLSEISRYKAAEAHQRMLRHELQHRVKNILATVGALASRMLKDGPSAEEFGVSFLARLQAMARTHDLLSRGNWSAASLRDLVWASLAPYGADSRHDSAQADGPIVLLGPEPAAALGLVLHELATNAAKYGALSTPKGYVRVNWSVAEGATGRTVVVHWDEQGGPPAIPPAAEGFGLGFVRRSVQYELAGAVDMDFSAEGLHCTITFPVEGGVRAGGTAK